MDQLRYNDEKARLSYLYANGTALRRFIEAAPHIRVGSSIEALEFAILATSDYLRCGPGAGWSSLAMAAAYLLAAYEAHGGWKPADDTPLGVLASCSAALRAYGNLCIKGERKYARGNYRLGAPVTHYLDSELRHANALLRGEVEDPEMEEPHVTCAFWNAWQALDQPDWRDDRLPMVQIRPTIAEAYASPARVPEGVVYAN